MKKFIIFITGMLLFLSIKGQTLAEAKNNINPCAGVDQYTARHVYDCGETRLTLGLTFGYFASLLFLLALSFSIYFVLRGIFMILLSKNPERFKDGRKSIFKGLIVFLIIAIVYILLNLILSFFGPSSGGVDQLPVLQK